MYFVNSLIKYTTKGVLPGKMCQSVFAPLPKKTGKFLCEEHRTISLMSHLTKVLLKLVGKRIKPEIETELNANQFGFRSDFGTRNAVFVLKNIGQRSIEMQKDIYMCLVDYTKAFDRIEHNKLMPFLDDLSLDDKDLRAIQALYYQQYAAIRVNSKLSEIVAIKCSVRQGYILSPDLFSLFNEIVIRSLDNLQGVSIGGHNIQNLRYADDTVLLAHTEEDLQAL